MLTKIITATIIALTPLTLTACTPQPSTPTSNTQQYNPKDFTNIIDVRTQEEYNKEHIPNATLISINNPNFETEINKLDKKGNYYIYANSEGRPKSAINKMKDNGFTGKLINGGNVFDAAKQLNLEVKKPND